MLTALTHSTRALILLTALAAAPGLQAQTVQGRISDIQNGQPISGARVRLIDRDDDARATTSSDRTGRFTFSVPGEGVYRVSVEQLGYATLESEPFEARGATGMVTLDLSMQPAPLAIEGVEVSADVVNRRIRQFLGTSPSLLRVRPIPLATIRRNAMQGGGVSELMERQSIAGLQVRRSRQGPCYQMRGRGCLPVFLDGARLSAQAIQDIPLEMLGSVVVLLPNELVSYPDGAVHLLTGGFMR